MKKTLSFLFVIFALACSLNAQKNLISFSFGINSGIPVYGTEDSKKAEEKLENPNRFVIGTYALLNLNIIETASVFTGADLLTDFNWEDSNYANHLHFDIPLGLRLSPNLAGFSFGTAYLLGLRGDFYSLTKNDKSSSATPWGNGFKLFAEYDFSYHGYKFLPTIGLSWTIMPRGNNEYDNLLNLYMGLNL